MYIRPFIYYDEIWVPITNDIVLGVRENRYIVSNYGYISNIDYDKHQMVFSFKYCGQFNNRPYVNLTDVNGNNIIISVSRIVAKAFCPGYEPGLEVNHKDGNPSNNYYTNLEWITRAENIRHAYDNNLIQSLVNYDQVHIICKLLEEDRLSAIEIASLSGIDKVSTNPIALISAIKKKKIWTHISKDYNIPLGRHGRLFTDDQINIICSILEKDINASFSDILSILQIYPVDNNDFHRYKNAISAIRHRRKYTYISDKYSF